MYKTMTPGAMAILNSRKPRSPEPMIPTPAPLGAMPGIPKPPMPADPKATRKPRDLRVRK